MCVLSGKPAVNSSTRLTGLEGIVFSRGASSTVLGAGTPETTGSFPLPPRFASEPSPSFGLPRVGRFLLEGGILEKVSFTPVSPPASIGPGLDTCMDSPLLGKRTVVVAAVVLAAEGVLLRIR